MTLDPGEAGRLSRGEWRAARARRFPWGQDPISIANEHISAAAFGPD